MAAKTGRNTEALLVSLMADLLPRVRADQLAISFVLPAQLLLQCFRDLCTGQSQPWVQGSPSELPYALWARIRERYPEAGAFPLGSVAERSVKRFLGSLGGPLSGPKKALSSDEDLTAELVKTLRGQSVGKILHAFVSFWLFEAAILNLRGASKELEQDYGFWYHWTPSGRLRTQQEELRLRKELWDECRSQAHQLLTVLKKHASSKSFRPTVPEVVQAFHKVFGASPLAVPEWRRAGLSRPLNVFGFEPDAEFKKRNAIADDGKLIIVNGDEANVQVEPAELLEQCGGKLHSLLRDLLDIAATVYMADIYIERGDILSRDLSFLIPVRHPRVWSEHADALARPINFMSRNTVEFRFVDAQAERDPEGDFRATSDERCVSLFSGGADSFVGTTQLLADKRQPLFVSHYPAPMLKGIQMRLLQALRSRHPGLVHVQVGVSRRTKTEAERQLGRPPTQVLYQHCRSFLFLSLASCLAIGNGIADIFVHENGPVALNPTFSEARFNTRTTHPVFFGYFRDLINRVFGVELRIQNPFTLSTKGELLERLDPQWRTELRKANSCWSYARVMSWASGLNRDKMKFQGRHCGRCPPCVWRRAAFKRAGLTGDDDSYLWDYVPTEEWAPWLDRQHLTLLLDQRRFCKNVLASTDGQLVDLCPDFYEGDGTVPERIDMYRRFAGELEDWFQTVEDKLCYPLP